MSRVKEWLVGIGVSLACFGYSCLPTGQSLNPKHFLSLFAKSADGGTFIPFGLMLMAIGAFITLTAIFLPVRK